MTSESEPTARAGHWLSIGRPERALDELGTEVSAEAGLVRAAALIDLGRHQDAVGELRSNIADTGASAVTLSLLCLAERERGDLRAAESAALAGLAVTPEHLGLLCQYATVCLYDGDRTKASQLVDLAEAAHGPVTQVLEVRMDIAAAAGERRLAERLGRELAARNPEGRHERAGLAVLAWDRADVVTAAHTFGRLAAENPADGSLVEAAVRARVLAHPAMRPMRPSQRVNPVLPWLGIILVTGVLRLVGWEAAAVVVVTVWIVYVGYGWLASTVIERRLRRRLR